MMIADDRFITPRILIFKCTGLAKLIDYAYLSHLIESNMENANVLYTLMIQCKDLNVVICMRHKA